MEQEFGESGLTFLGYFYCSQSGQGLDNSLKYKAVFCCVAGFATFKASFRVEVLLRPCIFLEQRQGAACSWHLSIMRTFFIKMPHSQVSEVFEDQGNKIC